MKVLGTKTNNQHCQPFFAFPVQRVSVGTMFKRFLFSIISIAENDEDEILCNNNLLLLKNIK